MSDVVWQPIAPPLLIGGLALLALAVCVRGLWRGQRLHWLLRAAVVVVLGAMCLRPTVPAPPQEVALSDADVYLAVDTTASMGATDGPEGTSRLDLARADALAMVDQLAGAGARVSLVTFDREARTVVPLTSDSSAVQRAIALLQPELAAASRGSSITEADDLLARALTTVGENHPDRSTLLLYLGDGEHTAAGEPVSLAPLADLVQGGAVLGYGTAEGAGMPARQAGERGGTTPLVDPATGQPAVSRADGDRLRTLADELGLPYVHRDGGEAPTVPAPEVRLVFGPAGDVPAGSTEYTWVGALVLLGLLLVELVATLVALVRAGLPRSAR